MADTLKTLAQSYPNAGTLTTLYTVPSSTSTIVASIVICNITATDDSFRISIAIAGASDTNKQYIYWNQSVPSYTTFVATIGITLATTDLIRVYSTGGGLTFNAFGIEVV